MKHEQLLEVNNKNKVAEAGQNGEIQASGEVAYVPRGRGRPRADGTAPRSRGAAGSARVATSHAVAIKDEFYNYGDISDEEDSDGEGPWSGHKSHEFKIAVPVQPRNANGTFARAENDSQQTPSKQSHSSEKQRGFRKQEGLVRIPSKTATSIAKNNGNIFAIGKVTVPHASTVQVRDTPKSHLALISNSS